MSLIGAKASLVVRRGIDVASCSSPLLEGSLALLERVCGGDLRCVSKTPLRAGRKSVVRGGLGRVHAEMLGVMEQS